MQQRQAPARAETPLLPVDFESLTRDIWTRRFDVNALKRLRDDSLMNYMRKEMSVEYSRFWRNISYAVFGSEYVSLTSEAHEAKRGLLMFDEMDRYLTLLSHHDLIFYNKKSKDEVVNIIPGRKATKDLSFWFHFTRNDSGSFVRLDRAEARMPARPASLAHLIQLIGRPVMVMKISMTVDLHRPPGAAVSLASKQTIKKSARRLAERFKAAGGRYFQTPDRFFVLRLADAVALKRMGIEDAFSTAANERIEKMTFEQISEQLHSSVSESSVILEEVTRERAESYEVDLELESGFEPLPDTDDETLKARPPFGAVTGVMTLKRKHRGLPVFLTFFLSLDYAVVRWRLLSQKMKSLDKDEAGVKYGLLPQFECDQVIQEKHLGSTIYSPELLYGLTPPPVAKIPFVMDVRAEIEPNSGKVVAIKGSSFANNNKVTGGFFMGTDEQQNRIKELLAKRMKMDETTGEEALLSEEDASGSPVCADLVSFVPTAVNERGKQTFSRLQTGNFDSTEILGHEVQIRGPLETSGRWNLELNELRVISKWMYTAPGNVTRSMLIDQGSAAVKATEGEYWKHRKQPKYIALSVPAWARVHTDAAGKKREYTLLDYNYHVFALKSFTTKGANKTDPGDRVLGAIRLPEGFARNEISWPHLRLEHLKSKKISSDILNVTSSSSSKEQKKKCTVCRALETPLIECQMLKTVLYRPLVCDTADGVCKKKAVEAWKKTIV